VVALDQRAERVAVAAPAARDQLGVVRLEVLHRVMVVAARREVTASRTISASGLTRCGAAGVASSTADVRVLIQHHSRYRYPRPAALGPQTIRLRPASHTRARVERYRLAIEPDHRLHWQQDPHGNHLARVTFKVGQRLTELDVLVELAVEISPVNPFDFVVDDRARIAPFSYPDGLAGELAPFLDRRDDAYRLGPRGERLSAELPAGGDTVGMIVEINRQVNQRIRYVIRDEPGIWTPEETLTAGRGSCRDSAVLLVALLRARGLAARFVSGYLVQLTDEGMLPDEPRGVGRDVVDLHAWAEVYLPGAGWIGLDGTSGLLTGEGHIPLACTASPALAAPLDGTSDVGAESVAFSTAIARIGFEPRPTAPYTDEVWEELLAAGDAADAQLRRAGLTLTIGGEPTFVSRHEPELPEWNGAALGASKWERGQALAAALRDRLAPGGAILHRMGKQYPGESLPRWALDVIARRDGEPIWSAAATETKPATTGDAHHLLEELCAALGVPPAMLPVHEDPWRLIRDESQLPVDAAAALAEVGEPDARRKLAAGVDRDAGRVVGWVLPLARAAEGSGWLTEQWVVRRGTLFLIPGDSPIGLRLPLGSLGPGQPVPVWDDAPDEQDPRRADADTDSDADADADADAETETDREDTAKFDLRELRPPRRRRRPRGTGIPSFDPNRTHDDIPRQAWVRRSDVMLAETAPAAAVAAETAPATTSGIRTALCVEPRDGVLWVFLPPLGRFADFLTLVAAIDRARAELGCDVRLEGYPPPPSPAATRFAVTPDPGVLEVNLPPTATCRDAAALVDVVHTAALACGLTAEKYLLDGRVAGSGGGNHITLGGPTPLASPFLVRPDLLAGLVTFVQHHPAMSYLFTGLFVGPTSQAPRVDEARHDALYELELAIDRVLAPQPTPVWMIDALFRHLLVDVAGSTHRAELSIDKLFDPGTPFGRQGLVELRAFEMPPHPRMAAAQLVLARAVIAALASDAGPYRGRLVRWGQDLHDRWLLPYFLDRDLADVLDFLAGRGVALPLDAYRPFVELRCPRIGIAELGDVELELRNAIEPWHVLGEEVTAAGTARYVDSSVERIEVRARGLVDGRHRVIVNSATLPMHATVERDLRIAGVKFRAWCPPHALHPHLGIHHPLRIEVLDTWAKRSLGACIYHVWHPEGRAFESPPLTRVEAAARRAQRFTRDGGSPWPVRALAVDPHPDQPYTLDLRRLALDHPMPRLADWVDPDAS
jgi:uncharacterized protein (DUF2126 family)